VADLWTAAFIVYVAGVLLGLVIVDEPFPARLGVAAAWPLGPIGFVVTITVLLLALALVSPRVALLLAALGAVIWWIWASF